MPAPTRRRRPPARVALSLCLAAAAATATACSDRPLAPDDAVVRRPQAALVDPYGSAKLVVDASPAIFFDILFVYSEDSTGRILRSWSFQANDDGKLVGTIVLPPGWRRIRIDGYSIAANRVTHRGDTALFIISGANPRVNVRLDDLVGPPFIPASAAVGSYHVVVSASADTAEVASRVAFTARVYDPDGIEQRVGTAIAWTNLTPTLGTLAAVPASQPSAATLAAGRTAGTARVRFCLFATHCAESKTVLSDAGYVAVDAGGRGACALKPSGRVYCWGSGGAGVAAIATPQYFSSISVGGDSTRTHACGISATDSLTYCWGSNDRGQLGIGSIAERVDVPTAVSTTVRFTSVSAGGYHSCGLTAEGSAYCWGGDGREQLGNGGADDDTADVLTPTRVIRRFGNGALPSFIAISAGATHSCAISTANAMYCWGDDRRYYGTWDDFLAQPTPGIKLGYDWDECQGSGIGGCYSPTPVPFDSAFRSVSAGGNTTCGLFPANRLYCWGRFVAGALDVPSTRPQRVQYPYLNFVEVSAGYDHICALTQGDAGTVGCWGRTDFGQSPGGNSSGDADERFIQVGATPQTGSWRTVSAGTFFTCAIASGRFGPNMPSCWGRNDAYQLGAGTTTGGVTPVEVRVPR